jgi:hypothetical protein
VIDERLALLGLGEGFSLADLRAAYRSRVRLVHPDLAVSDEDRVRRTRETIRLNLAYAELRNASARSDPHCSQDDPLTSARSVPQKARKVSPVVTWDSILAFAGALVAGLTASTITGNSALTVGVMLVGTLGARWAHVRDDTGRLATRQG